MNTVFDIGMFDGADTQYYLSLGYKVVAVEADPTFAEAAAVKFQAHIDDAQLVIHNNAVSNTPGSITFNVCGDDRGSSSIFADRLAKRRILGTFSVATITYGELVQMHGVPMFAKIDIEGADTDAVLSMNPETAPPYLSFEADDNLPAMILYAHDLGYRNFKIIQQNSFRCLQNQDCLSDRVRMKAVRLAGYERPHAVKRDGRLFTLCHSAGPAPWVSDGRWYSRVETVRAWAELPRRGWYDLHAAKPAALQQVRRTG